MPPALRKRVQAVVASAVTALLLVVGATPLQAQLRPLEPVDWAIFDEGTDAAAFSLGAGLYGGQRASMTGTVGRLLELGTFSAAWRQGRFALRLSGTAFRIYRDDRSFAAPLPGVRPPDGRWRGDTGDHRVSTLVRLTRDSSSPGGALLRFGVRLPTSDNHIGLGRDRTDFYATVVGRAHPGPLEVVGEAGVGVYGTRSRELDQVDPLLYSLRIGRDEGVLRPHLTFVGQHDTRDRAPLRGIEDLEELRLGATVASGHRWIRVEGIRGVEVFSPSWGLQVVAGYLL